MCRVRFGCWFVSHLQTTDVGLWPPVATKQQPAHSKLYECRRHGQRLLGIARGVYGTSPHTQIKILPPFWWKAAICRAHSSMELAGSRRSTNARVISCHALGALNDLGVSGSDDTVAVLVLIFPVTSCWVKVKQCRRQTRRCTRGRPCHQTDRHSKPTITRK